MLARHLEQRLWFGGFCSLVLLGYVVFIPALYPPIILDVGHRVFFSVASCAAVVSLFPVLRRGSRSERRWALGILTVVILAAAEVLYEELSYLYG